MTTRQKVGVFLIVIGGIAALASLSQPTGEALEFILRTVTSLEQLDVVLSLPLATAIIFLVVRSFLFMGEGHERLGAYASPLTLAYIVSWLVYLFSLDNEGLVLVPYVVFLIFFGLLYWVAKKSFVVVDRTAMVLGLLFAILYLPLLILATNIFVE